MERVSIGVEQEAVDPPRQQDRLFHDLLLGEETIAVRQEVREIVEAHVAPRAAEIGQREEALESFPRDVFDSLAKVGLYAIPFPAPFGRGLQYPATATATAIEELAYWSNSVAAIFDVHCILAGHAVELGSERLRERYLRRIVDGSAVGAFATSEPLASSDLSPEGVATRAKRGDGGFIVSGQKRFITNAPVADFIVTLCNVDGALTLLVVDTAADGLRVGRPDRKLGNKGQLTADVYYENVWVPEENLIGDIGEGLRHALATLTYGRVGIGAAGVGMAQAAFDLAASHLAQRKAFGRKLAEFQDWQFRMAHWATELECARTLYQKAALRLDDGVAFPEPEAAMAKLRGTALAVDLAREAIQAFGGYGFLRELAAEGQTFRLEELYRDSKIGEIYEGANEIQKWVIARAIFGREITG